MSTSTPRRLFSASAFLRWITPAILALALLGTALGVSSYLEEDERSVEQAGLLARAAALDLDRFLQSQLGSLRGIASADPVVATDPVAMKAYLERIGPAAIGFDGELFWVDATGTLRARSGYTGPPLDFSDREWVREVLVTGEPYVSNARVGQLNQAPIVVLAVPTRDAAGLRTGVLGGAIRLDREASAPYSIRSAAGTPVLVVDRTGALIAGPEPLRELVPVADAFPLAAYRAAGAGAFSGVVGPTGEAARLVGFATAPTASWLVVVDRPLDAALAPARARLGWQLALVLLLTSLALAAGGWASRRVAAALREQEAATLAERDARSRLEVLVAGLREREQLHEAFVGVLSHELRTPVTTIYGMSSVLSRSLDRADGAALVEDIRDEADRLNRIVDDLLVLSRAERGALQVTPEPVLVQRVVAPVAADLGRRFPAVPLVVDLPADLPPVAGDEGLLRQVLTNLLTNAAKYGGGTPVRLTGRALPGGGLELRVEDSGPGFAPDDAERLFDLFYRSPGASRQVAGTGIGLYVVRQLVEALGGQVSAALRPGGGAMFRVTLDAYAADPGDLLEHPARPEGGPAALPPDPGPEPPVEPAAESAPAPGRVRQPR